MAILAVAGLVATASFGGKKVGVGFAVGALFSALNFYLWHRMVARIGEASSPSPVFFGLRYFGFVLAGYAILNYFEASVLAALAGCFVAVAAVILEILLELIYGT